MSAIVSVVDISSVPEQARSLTAEQMEKARSLYAFLLDLRERGERLALVHLDDALGVRPVGRRVDVAPEPKSDVN